MQVLQPSLSDRHTDFLKNIKCLEFYLYLLFYGLFMTLINITITINKVITDNFTNKKYNITFNETI